jgi:hypothetical protein
MANINLRSIEEGIGLKDTECHKTALLELVQKKEEE